MALFGEMRHEIMHLDGGELRYLPDWVAGHEADSWLATLLHEVQWQQPEVTLFGRTRRIPRLVAWHGDPGVTYRYSGLTHRAAGWTPLLEQIRQQVEDVVGRPFNGVLLNLYRDGEDVMGWHSDDEPELGPNPLIASLSLGSQRRFDLRRKGESAMRHSLWLEHGSLLIMAGATQHNWQHRIARCGRTQSPRLNLTFRHIQPQPGD